MEYLKLRETLELWYSFSTLQSSLVVHKYIFCLFNFISVESGLRILNFDVRVLAQKWNANWIMMMLITDLNSIMEITYTHRRFERLLPSWLFPFSSRPTNFVPVSVLLIVVVVKPLALKNVFVIFCGRLALFSTTSKVASFPAAWNVPSISAKTSGSG